jgi:hypothetical protein
MPYAWTEPTEVLTHQGVTVYHVYKNEFWDAGTREFLYRTDITEESEPFDLRDLESYQLDMEHAAILKLAIERGEISAPAD